MTVSQKRVLVCNTGICDGRVRITPDMRPSVEVSGNFHYIPSSVAGLCPDCGEDAGFIDRDSAAGTRRISNLFRF